MTNKSIYLNRDIEKTILDAAKYFQAITIYGSRQVGKSTTVRYLFNKGFNYVSLDDTDELSLALSNPKGFIDAHPWPLIIDEVQKATNLLSEIKIRIDEQRLKWLNEKKERQLMYVLTGSNQFELQNGISESLAGRTAIINMSSLTRLESIKQKGDIFNPSIKELLEKENKTNIKILSRKEVFDVIYRGSMPDVVTRVSSRELYYKSYIDTYIEKDVKRLIAASSEMLFRNFLSLVSLRTAQEINYVSLASDCGIDVNTCKRWLSILETSGIIYLLQPYMSKVSRRIIKAPKLYFMDTGLCAYLCKWPNSEMLEKCAMAGAFFETYVISEIIKSFINVGKDPKATLYYYRDSDKKEIDLLYVERDLIYPIEIKKGINPIKPTKNFSVLEKYKMKIMPGLIIDSTDKIRPINENAYTFPVSFIGL